MEIIMIIIGAIFLFVIAPVLGLYAYIFSNFFNFIKFFFLFSIGLSLISFVIKIIITLLAGAFITFDSDTEKKDDKIE